MQTTQDSSALHTVHARLAVPPTLELAHSLSFLCSFRPTRDEQRITGDSLTKAWSIDGRAALVSLRAEDGGLAARVTSSSRLASDTLERLLARVRFQLSLDDELAGLEERAERDEAFAPVARRWRGHHHVKFPTPFEIAVWAVLAQRNQRLGRRAKDAIVQALGPRVVVDGCSFHAFPEPEAVLAAGVRGLERLSLDTARVEAIQTLARAFVQPSYEPWLRGAPIDVAEAELRTLPRIGPWSAAFVLFRGLGRMERLAAASEPILAAARGVYGPRSERELRAIASSYGTWCGYWALYLRRG